MSEGPKAPPSLDRIPIHPPSVQLLGHGFCRKKHVVVLGEVAPDRADPVQVGMLDPEDRDLGQRLQRFLHRPIVPVRLSLEEIEHALEIGYERWKERTDRASLELPAGSDADAEDVPESQAVLEAVLDPAVSAGASHVHIERRGLGVGVRMRIDGRLHPVQGPLLRTNVDAVLSRLRALAGIDDQDEARPQHGRLTARFGPPGQRRPIELRFFVAPGLDGDEATLRLFDPQAPVLTPSELGLPPAAVDLVQGAGGLVVVAGPAGSGTTTTLHALLRTIDPTTHKVVAIEDPVERRLEGISQRPVTATMGLAQHVRALPRQDVDVVLVGDLPDAETARAAVRVAERGARVLTHVFAPDALGAVASVQGLGVAPDALARTLRGVIAQRLLPRLCPDCREAAPDEAWTEALFHRLGRRFAHARARGCERCGGTGQRGRLGIFEVLVIDDALREAIGAGRPRTELLSIATAAGHRTLLESAILRAEQGELTLTSLRGRLGA